MFPHSFSVEYVTICPKSLADRSLQQVYGEVEHFFGWLKVISIVGLAILMLAISCGGRPRNKNQSDGVWT
jgi:amino acid permease